MGIKIKPAVTNLFNSPVNMGIVRADPSAMLCKGGLVLIYPYLFLILQKEKLQGDYSLIFFSYNVLDNMSIE